MSDVDGDTPIDETIGKPPYRRAPRPSIPYVSLLAFIVWLAMVLAEELCWRMFLASAESDRGNGTTAVVVLCVCAALCIAICLVKRWSSPLPMRVMLAVGVFLLALGIGMLYWISWQRAVEEVETLGEGVRIVRVVSDYREAAFGNVSEGVLVGEGAERDIRIIWKRYDPLPSGSTFRCRGTLTPTKAVWSGRWNHQQGIVATIATYRVEGVSATQDLRGLVQPLRERAFAAFEDRCGPGAPLLEGLVLGDRRRLEASGYDDAFRLCGLSHLVAVSGSHLVVVAALAAVVLRRSKMDRRLQVMVMALLLLLYTVLSGLQVSAMRALLMTFIALAAPIVGRRGDALGACGLCALALLVLSPDCAFSLSFQLSFLAVYGIALFMPLLREWGAWLFHHRLGGVSDALSLTLAAQSATLPLTVPVFSLLPLLSPLTNIVVAPLVAPLIGAGLVLGMAACVVPSTFLAVPLGALGAFSQLVCDIVASLARIPGVSIPACWSPVAAAVIGVALASATWLFWPHPTRRHAFLLAVSVLCVFVFANIPVLFPSPSKMVMLDVGQGDAILFKEGRHTVLIDTGNQDAKLLSELARNGVTHLDAVIVTHLHDDHYGSLDALAGVITVDAVYFARPALEGGHDGDEALLRAVDLVGYENIRGLAFGDRLSLGNFDFDVRWPRGYEEGGGNADSICLSVAYDKDDDGRPEVTGLLMGDAEHDTLKALRTEGLGPVDIVKIGHHGSAVSLDADDLEHLDPKLALVSVGEHNRYGHPSEGTMDLLASQGCAVRRTDLDGEIRVSFVAGGFTISCDTM